MKLSEARVLFLARESLAKLRDEGLAEIANFPLALRKGAKSSRSSTSRATRSTRS